MWDDDIDEIARALTEARPSADLKARVMERIGNDAQPRRSWRVWWLMPAAVAATLAVGLIWPNHRRVEPVHAPAPMTTDRALKPEPPRPTVAASAGQRQQPVRVAQQPPAGDPTALQLEALRVSTLELEPIQVGTMPEVASIETKSLAMTPLAFRPLAPEDGQPPH
jgi:hypothetical protein